MTAGPVCVTVNLRDGRRIDYDPRDVRGTSVAMEADATQDDDG